MKIKPLLAHFLLFLTPIAAGVSLAASPSQAATLASSGSEFEFNNFSQNPYAIETSANTNTEVFSNAGSVYALATAEATFLVDPPLAFNSSVTQVFGENKNYFGLAQSQAQVLGNFIVEAGKSFSFDFTGFLELGTAIDESVGASASAFANIYFLLIDNTDSPNSTVLDYFGIFGKVTTPENTDFLESENSENVALTSQSKMTSFGGKQESASARFTGTYSREFTSNTNLALVEVKQNEASVDVPEPSSTLAVLFFCTVGVGYKKLRCQ